MTVEVLRPVRCAAAALVGRGEWQFLASLPSAGRGLSWTWLLIIVARAAFPVGFVVSLGLLVDKLGERSVTGPFALLGFLFVATNLIPPLLNEASENLGDRLVGSYNERLIRAVSRPRGISHLERSDLAADVVDARDFDLALSGPPISVAMGFIANGLSQQVTGLGMSLVLLAYHWWAVPLMILAWGSTNWLLRETAIWRERSEEEVSAAQRRADYYYRLAVDSGAAKEIRIFGLADWVVNQFLQARLTLMQLRLDATRLRARGLAGAVFILVVAHALLFSSLANDVLAGEISLGQLLTFTLAGIGTVGIAFGGFNWTISMCGQVVAALRRVEDRCEQVSLQEPGRLGMPVEPLTDGIALRGVEFRYHRSRRSAIVSLDLDIPAGTSLAVVGSNGAGKTTIVKLLARLYEPTGGRIEIDGRDLQTLDAESWREQIAAVFQDYVRYDLSLRDNVAPRGASEEDIRWALRVADAHELDDLDVPLGSGYPGSRELSGGQWQRVAIARAICAVRNGARLVILDEPTAQLDVRAERDVFERILKETPGCTTILASHRFATVRKADRICVVDEGRVAELGTHDELMARRGLYYRMFTAQAARFNEDTGE